MRGSTYQWPLGGSSEAFSGSTSSLSGYVCGPLKRAYRYNVAQNGTMVVPTEYVELD